MGDSRRNSDGSVDTMKYSHSQSTITNNYSDQFDSEPEQIHEIKRTPSFRKVKKKTTQWKKKQATNTKLQRITPTYEVEQKIVTAKKLNSNELRNLNTDLLRQVEKQKDEIRILKRMEFRQGKALEKFENSKSRLPMLLESHNKEMLSMKEQLRTVKARYRKSQESLREMEDEMEKTKNRLNKYKVLVDDENLQERAELTKQFNVAQQKVTDLETKIQDLETHIHHLVKNHKYEVNVEKTQSKKMKLSSQELEEKYNRLEIQLLEKEKELEVWNIYSNRQRNTTQKMISSHFNTPRSTPSVRSKFIERVPPLTPPPLRMKRYEERRRQSRKHKESMLKRANQSSPTAAGSTKIVQPSVSNNGDFNPPMKALNQTEKATEPMAAPKLSGHQSMQEEDTLGEMLENLKLEKIESNTLAEPVVEPEKTAIKDGTYKYKESRKYEMEKIEENARKEKEQLQKEEENERKKELLLAKLKVLDNEPQSLTSSPRSDRLTDTPSRTGYSFTKEIENLHQGKPSNDLHFLDSSLKLSPGKPNSVAKSNPINAGAPTHKRNRLSSRKSDNMIEDFFPSSVSPQDAGKISSFVNGDTASHHGSSENRTKLRKPSRMESSVYKELFGENVEDKDNELIFGDVNHRPSRQDSVWLNQSVSNNVGGLFSGDGLNNSYNDGSKLLPSRPQVSIFETRSTLNTFDNSSDSIEEIIL